MPTFVHLTSHKHLTKIKREGIAASYRGVFAVPVTPNFYASHQWLRELKREGNGEIFGVYFRVPASEPCLIGRYTNSDLKVTAAEAVGVMMSLNQGKPAADGLTVTQAKRKQLPSSVEGYEVIFSRKIKSREIIRVKRLPQVIGWRYFPEAKGKPPCVCLECDRGEYGIRKLLTRVEEAEAKGTTATPIVCGREEDSFRRVERLRQQINSR